MQNHFGQLCPELMAIPPNLLCSRQAPPNQFGPHRERLMKSGFSEMSGSPTSIVFIAGITVPTLLSKNHRHPRLSSRWDVAKNVDDGVSPAKSRRLPFVWIR